MHPNSFHDRRGLGLLLALLSLALCAPAQAQIARDVEVTKLAPLQPGTTLPVVLEHSVEAGRSLVGARVIAKTTQRVPVASHLYLKPGAELLGQVTASQSTAGKASPGATLSVRFTSLRSHRQTIAILLNAVAIASSIEVRNTFAPANGSTDRGNPSPASWTTRQVGGDEVVRSGWSGDVVNTVTRKVGFADYNGVYCLPSGNASSLDFPLATGVFSTTAAGLYGFDPKTTLASAYGEITLRRPGPNLVLHGGDHLLLQVTSLP